MDRAGLGSTRRSAAGPGYPAVGTALRSSHPAGAMVVLPAGLGCLLLLWCGFVGSDGLRDWQWEHSQGFGWRPWLAGIPMPAFVPAADSSTAAPIIVLLQHLPHSRRTERCLR
jgi:hypothetical protein